MVDLATIAVSGHHLATIKVTTATTGIILGVIGDQSATINVNSFC
jgi:hypothetical protein